MDFAELFKKYLEILKKLREKNYTLYLMHIFFVGSSLFILIVLFIRIIFFLD